MIHTPQSRKNVALPALGISAVAQFQPNWTLPNEWFESIPRKFVKHTGFLSRPVSLADEVELAIRATENLVRQTGCDLQKCAGVVLTSPSFVPMSIARKFLSEKQARNEQLNRAAGRFVEQMGIRPRRIAATNTFCVGLARAMSIVLNKFNPVINLQADEFLLLLTSSCISRITDYSCRETGALFGDLATATLISRTDSETYPVHFELLKAFVGRKPTSRPFFRFALRENVLAPTADGGSRYDQQRLVFSLDGMGIADTAPRAMASAAKDMLMETGWQADDVKFVIPHQAGSAIVRLAEMKLRETGFCGTVVNEMTSEVGNVSSGSIPYTLNKMWSELHGNILCPVAGVGPPDKNIVAQGCIALTSTPLHDRTRSG